MNSHFIECNLLFIMGMNWLGAFTRLYGRTCHSYKSNLAVTAILGLSAVVM